MLPRFAVLLISSLVGSIAASATDGVRPDSTDSKIVAAELKETPPSDLFEDLRKHMSATGLRITDSGKPVCDVWLRDVIPVLPGFEPQLDLQYPIEPGTFLGAIRFSTNATDFRRQPIKPGVYTLRYGHQPQDGNHLGTAQYRDFCTLAPAALDKSPETISAETAQTLSKKAAGTSHPAIMSLLPPQKDRKTLPTSVHDGSMEFDILVVRVPCKPDLKTKSVQLELVVVGHAAE